MVVHGCRAGSFVGQPGRTGGDYLANADLAVRGGLRERDLRVVRSWFRAADAETAGHPCECAFACRQQTIEIPESVVGLGEVQRGHGIHPGRRRIGPQMAHDGHPYPARTRSDGRGQDVVFEKETDRGIYMGRSDTVAATAHLLPRGMRFEVVSAGEGCATVARTAASASR